MQNQFDAIVIGGGPAGCAAATAIARCRWQTLLVDQGGSGHLASLGNVGYFPGFPESISGGELLKRMRRQAEIEGAHVADDTVAEIEGAAPDFKVRTTSGKEFTARAVVVATGAASRTNYLEGEREFLGRGVSHDAHIDGPSVARRAAAVVGKTRHAAEEAVALSRFAERVHFIIPSSKLDADDTLQGELGRHRNIELHFSTSLKKINGSDHVSSITVFINGQEKEIPAVGVFTYVHEYKATTAFLEGIVEMAAAGAVKVDRAFATTAPGIFACGDALCGRPQLPAIAASQGLLAGLSVDHSLAAAHKA